MFRAKPKRPTKPSRKPAKPAKRPAKTRAKVGGARPNSGPDPVLGPGNVRSVIKTVRLSPVEDARQQTAARRAGAKDWGAWIRDLGNVEASRSDRELLAGQLTREETSGAAAQLAEAAVDGLRRSGWNAEVTKRGDDVVGTLVVEPPQEAKTDSGQPDVVPPESDPAA